MLLFLFWDSRTESFELIQLRMKFERPTSSTLLGLVRKAIGSFLSFMDVSQILFSHEDKAAIGIHKPVDGIFLRLSPAMAQAGRELVRAFCSHRPIRRTCDLARPFRICLTEPRLVLRHCSLCLAAGKIPSYALHSAIYTSHFRLYTLHFTLLTLHSTLYTWHSTLHTAHFPPHTFHFTLHTPQFPLHSLHTTFPTQHFIFFHTPYFALHPLPHAAVSTVHWYSSRGKSRRLFK